MKSSREYRLGRIGYLALSAEPLAVMGSLALAVVFFVVGIGVLHLTFAEAVVASFAAVVLHWISDLLHQLGHAWAAQSTGHPMVGIHFGFLGILSSSRYPPDEIELPPAIHIRRALGGPTMSLLVAALAFLVVRPLEPGGVLGWLGVFFLVDNLFVLGLGSLVPLGFTDGSTVLHWVRKWRH